jgi:hypothetical protein
MFELYIYTDDQSESKFLGFYSTEQDAYRVANQFFSDKAWYICIEFKIVWADDYGPMPTNVKWDSEWEICR